MHIDRTTLSNSTERTSGLTFYDAMRVYQKKWSKFENQRVHRLNVQSTRNFGCVIHSRNKATRKQLKFLYLYWCESKLLNKLTINYNDFSLENILTFEKIISSRSMASSAEPGKRLHSLELVCCYRPVFQICIYFDQ